MLKICNLRLLRTFAGVLRENFFMHTILKENMATHISLERLINVDFGGKNMYRRFLQFCKRKSQTTAKMTKCYSIELIGYQIQAHWQNNCSANNHKGSIIKSMSAFFDILTGYFLN